MRYPISVVIVCVFSLLIVTKICNTYTETMGTFEQAIGSCDKVAASGVKVR